MKVTKNVVCVEFSLGARNCEYDLDNLIGQAVLGHLEDQENNFLVFDCHHGWLGVDYTIVAPKKVIVSTLIDLKKFCIDWIEKIKTHYESIKELEATLNDDDFYSVCEQFFTDNSDHFGVHFPTHDLAEMKQGIDQADEWLKRITNLIIEI